MASRGGLSGSRARKWECREALLCLGRRGRRWYGARDQGEQHASLVSDRSLVHSLAWKRWCA